MKAAKVTINKILIAHRSQSIHSILFRIPRLKHRNTGSNGAAGMTGGMCPPLLLSLLARCSLTTQRRVYWTSGRRVRIRAVSSLCPVSFGSPATLHLTPTTLAILSDCATVSDQYHSFELYSSTTQRDCFFYKQQLKSHFEKN